MRKKFSIHLLILLSASQLLGAQPTKFEKFKKTVAQKVSTFTKKAKEVINPTVLAAASMFGIVLYLLIKNNRALPAGTPQAGQSPAGTNPAPVVDDCTICQEGLGGLRTTLACNHTFHQNCINRWFAERGQNHNCPNCRRPVAPQAEQVQPIAPPVQQPVALPVVEPARPAAPQARAVPQAVRNEPPAIRRNISQELNDAASNGNLEEIERLLQFPGVNGVNINIQNTAGMNPLMLAARGGHREVVDRLLLVPDINVNVRDERGHSALMIAAQNTHPELVDRLLQFPFIDVNGWNRDGWIPLMVTTQGGDQESTEQLLQAPGFDVNERHDDFGNELSVLMWAARGGYQAMVDRLLRIPGIEVNARDTHGRSALLWATINGHQAVVERLLRVQGIDANMPDNDGWSALLRAARGGHQEMVERLLQVPGINVNARDNQGRSALMLADMNRHQAVVARLLQVPGIEVPAHNAETQPRAVQPAAPAPSSSSAVNPVPVAAVDDCTICQGSLNTGIRRTLACNHIFHQECINRWVVVEGHNNCPLCRRPVTPQTVAAQPVAQQARAVPQAVRNEPQPIRRNVNQELIEAARDRNLAAIEQLLQMPDINVNMPERLGAHRTALSEAAWRGHIAIVRRLLQENIDVNVRDGEGMNALMRAAEHGFREIIDLLLQVPGLEINARNNIGQTASEIARAGDFDGTADHLLQREQASFAEIQLRNAANFGNLASLEEALRTNGINVNGFENNDPHGHRQNALMIAAQNGNITIVERLLQVPGINVNARNGLGLTALMLTVQDVRNAGRLAVVERLLQVPGINVNARDTGGMSTLRHSFDCGNGRVPQLLRAHGAREAGDESSSEEEEE
jgi:ankyrin repeat protein